MSDIGMRRDLDRDFDSVLETIVPALGKEGFGVLTRIDMKETLKAKLGVEFRRYQILGACNPPFAHKALSTDLAVGLLLPCNVVVYEREPGKTTVIAVDPMQTMASGVPALDEIATEVKARLSRMLESL